MTVKSCKAGNRNEEFAVVQGRIGFEPRRSTTGKGQLTLSRPRLQHVCKGAARHSAADHLRSVDDHDRGSLCALAAGNPALCRPYAADRRGRPSSGIHHAGSGIGRPSAPSSDVGDRADGLVAAGDCDQLRRARGGAVGACPEFCPPVDPEVERPGGFAWLNRRRRSIDYGIVRFARDADGSQGGEPE